MDDVRCDHDGSPSPRRLMGDFLGLMQRQRQVLHRVFGAEEVHPAQAHCLRVLADCGEISQSRLAELMLLTRPTVTRMLQRMERDGYVRRRTDPDDQRLTRVGLTDEGQRLHLRLDAMMSEYVLATLGRLPESDRRELGRLLHTWRELADEALARWSGDVLPADADVLAVEVVPAHLLPGDPLPGDPLPGDPAPDVPTPEGPVPGAPSGGPASGGPADELPPPDLGPPPEALTDDLTSCTPRGSAP